MNILFVNYGNFTTNSLNHIGGFAGWLQAQGHACVVAVPGDKDTLTAVHAPQFTAATYDEVLARPNLFPSGRHADLIHAWTPRESVRKFLLACQRQHPARVVIHLEDHEEHLASAFAGRPFAELARLGDDELAAVLDEALPHPRRYKNLLRLADGFTVINDRLRELLPTGAPAHLLWPPVDFTLYRPQPADDSLRAELGLRFDEKIIVFTGSTTFANEEEMRELVRAVHLLNERGRRVRLVRTGFHPPEFTAKYDFDWPRCTLDLGFLEKTRLPALLALADVLVQPGRAGVFNDYRLPSKLPEFLAMGKPVVLPATNLGLMLRDREDALLLTRGDAAEIAGCCEHLFTDSSLAARLGANASAFARRHFDAMRIGAGLEQFYTQVHARPLAADWSALDSSACTETSLLPAVLRRQVETLVPATQPARGALLAAFDELARAIAQSETLAARGLARQLEGKLRADIDRLRSRVELAENHIVNLKSELDESRRGLAETRAWADASIARLEDAVAKFRWLAFNCQTELGRAHAEQLHLEDQIAQRECKIRRMQESISWRMTAPLRALRRQIVDPLRSPQPAPARPPAAAPPPSSFACFIDEPFSWHVPAGPLTIRGWCLDTEGHNISRIRAALGGRTVSGSVGLPREDVAAARGEGPAATSGFLIETFVEPGQHPFRLEAADAGGAWHLLVAETLHAFPPARPMEVESYQQWVQLYEPTSPRELRKLSERIATLPAPPLISVLMPVYNAPQRWLARAIASVREQVYPHWELCIADDASSAPHVRPLLEKAAQSDARIKVVFRTENGHISHASNSALALAHGEFVAPLDHDDELAPHALAEVALALAANPSLDLLYSDEDKIDEQGRRFSPYFKPDFLPDLFLGQNYLTHLAVYRTGVVRTVGGFRAGFEGSQDWDLALRVFEAVSPDRIGHIPKVLYHWRAIPGSTALTIDQKDYHAEAARRALADHLARTGRCASLETVPGQHWRIKYPLPPSPPLVSLLIPTRNGVRHLRRCVESIRTKTTYPNYEIIVVDNQSDDSATLSYLAEATASGIRVLPYPHPFNYSAINNYAAQHARGEVLGLLNDDLEVITPDWLDEMVAQALRPGIGCVGAMLYYPDDRIQHAGVLLGIGGVAGHAFKTFPRGSEGVFNRARLVQNYSAVTAACLVVRKAIYEQVGGLDTKALAIAFNDVDFCLKVRAAGYRNLWTPFAELYHHESASRGPEDTIAKQQRFRSEIETMQQRWGSELLHDPAYNPNLSLKSEDFALACPPRRGT